MQMMDLTTTPQGMQMKDKDRAGLPAEGETITSYKGFDQNWKCRGFQFAPSETFVHEGSVQACASGFHACEYPLDVLSYYPPAGNRFAVVEQSGPFDRDGDDTKIASKTLTIKAEIGLPGLIKAAVEYTIKRCKPVDPDSPASATGYSGAASATGKHSVAMACGYDGQAMAGETGAIVLAYRNDAGDLVHIRASKVGENGIKADTWYQLNADSQFVEVEPD